MFRTLVCRGDEVFTPPAYGVLYYNVKYVIDYLEGLVGGSNPSLSCFRKKSKENGKHVSGNVSPPVEEGKESCSSIFCFIVKFFKEIWKWLMELF